MANDQTGGPLVSVVVPTYQRLELLRKTIASVRAQTYRDWELGERWAEA